MRKAPVLALAAVTVVGAAIAMAGAQPARWNHLLAKADGGSAASPSSPPADLQLPAGMKLEPSFVENFDGPLDRSRWNSTFAEPGAGYRLPKRTLPSNGERQVYVDPAYLGLGLDPARVDKGVLSITATRLDARAKAALEREIASLPPQNVKPSFRRIDYASGMISQRGHFAQRYGYWETRMRWTAGNGVWPGFWLLNRDGRWPPEIDIVEAVGKEPGVVFSSTHVNTEPRNTTRRVPLGGSPQSFHTYGALWLPDRIDYFVDGVKTVTIPTTPDLNQPMYAIVNLAMGGNWPGDPDARTVMPARLDVDYVRIWKLSPAPK